MINHANIPRKIHLGGKRSIAGVEHLLLLRQGVAVWNEWRKKNPAVKPYLREAVLRRMDLNGVNLRDANLRKADLSGSKLVGADLRSADLLGASLVGADLSGQSFYLTVSKNLRKLAGLPIAPCAGVACGTYEQRTRAIGGFNVSFPARLSALVLFEGVHVHPTLSFSHRGHIFSLLLVRGRDVGVSYSLRSSRVLPVRGGGRSAADIDRQGPSSSRRRLQGRAWHPD